jgi:hypothetical protein
MPEVPESADVGVDERDGLAEVKARVGRVELPFRVFGIADGDPSALDEVDVAGEALDVVRFEIKRIVGNQDGGIGPAFDPDPATNIVEKAVAGADVVMHLVGVEVLVVVIKLNVSGGDGFEGLAVVFDVIGAKTRVPKVDVNVTISRGDVTAAALRFRFQVDNTAFGGRKTNLLSRGEACRRTGKGNKKGSQGKKSAQRGESPRTRMRIQAEHAVNENSWIA